MFERQKEVVLSSMLFLQNSGRRMYSVERQVGEEVYESILIFQPITFKDYGSVACVAYNDIGSSRTTVALDVVCKILL